MSDLPEARSHSGLRARRRRPSLKPVNRLILGANRPVGDAGIGQGMEMALTLAVFFGLGWLVDSWVGTLPIFTIALTVFATVGQTVRMWIAYDARMKVLEEERRQLAVRPATTEAADGGSTAADAPEVDAP